MIVKEGFLEKRLPLNFLLSFSKVYVNKPNLGYIFQAITI